jgi:hypothetical protein
MNFTNQHQPYIFKNLNNEINIITSEFSSDGITFNFGDYQSTEDRWKLHILDSNYVKTIINTPNTITYEGITYDVIAECNGYIEDNIISYVIGGFDNINQNYLYFLVSGEFNDNTVSNLTVLGRHRTGFQKQNDVYTIFKNQINRNNLPLDINITPYIVSIVRIIPIYGHNKMLITGIDHMAKHITLLYDMDTNTLKKVTSPATENIYKSSIYNYDNVKLMAYTDKVYTSNDYNKLQLSQSNYNYNLNIESDFIINELD